MKRKKENCLLTFVLFLLSVSYYTTCVMFIIFLFLPFLGTSVIYMAHGLLQLLANSGTCVSLQSGFPYSKPLYLLFYLEWLCSVFLLGEFLLPSWTILNDLCISGFLINYCENVLSFKLIFLNSKNWDLLSLVTFTLSSSID